jgi:hypothetical protein
MYSLHAVTICAPYPCPKDKAIYLSYGTWYHVVGTYDGTNIKMYVNGKLEDSRATTVTPGTQTSSFVIGKNAMASNRYLDGKIDDVRIYNYALSLAQIQKIYNGGGSVNFGPATGQP